MKTDFLRRSPVSNVGSKILCVFHNRCEIDVFSCITFVPGNLIFSFLVPVSTTDRLVTRSVKASLRSCETSEVSLA